jgi:hypothetical protein
LTISTGTDLLSEQTAAEVSVITCAVARRIDPGKPLSVVML